MNKKQAKAKLSASIKTSGVKIEQGIINLIQLASDNFVQQVADNMNKNNMTYKGNIEVVVTNTTQVQILIPLYLDYVDKGVNGTEKSYGSPYTRKAKKPPISAVREYMNEKGIPIENGNDYAMQLEWHRSGQPPRDIFGSLLLNFHNEIQTILLENLGSIIIEDINNSIENK